MIKLDADNGSTAGYTRVVNGSTRSGPNPARTRKCKPEPESNLKLYMSPKNYLQIFVQFNAKFCSILLLFTLLYGLQPCNTKLVYVE